MGFPVVGAKVGLPVGMAVVGANVGLEVGLAVVGAGVSSRGVTVGISDKLGARDRLGMGETVGGVTVGVDVGALQRQSHPHKRSVQSKKTTRNN